MALILSNETINEIWKNNSSFINKHGNILLDTLEELFKYKKININNDDYILFLS